MKQLLSLLLAGGLLACAPATAQKSESKEHISRQFELKKPASQTTLTVYNVEGFIKVESYTGSKVLVEIDKTTWAKTDEMLKTGLSEFRMEFEQTGDSILIYIAEPYDSRPGERHRDGSWKKKVEYRTNLNFTIKVPAEINLCVSTVNNGTIEVKNVDGAIKANNINGGITLLNARGATDVHTINGEVTINYLSIPPAQSSYYSLNGAIRVTYPASLSADVQFKSFNGEFFTDFPDTQLLTPEVTKNIEQKSGSTVYKLDKKSAVRIGNGGRKFKFETFNGNIYIKKQS